MQRRSPLHYRHLAAGAALTGDDWPLPARFTTLEAEVQALRESCGLIDLSTTVKWELKGHGLASFLAGHLTKEVDWAKHRTAGVMPPELGGGAGLWCVPADERALLIRDRPVTAEVEGRLAALDFPALIHLTDVTSIYAHLVLAGPKSREVLSRLTSLNLTGQALPNGSCAQAALARCQCTYLRVDTGEAPVYHLLIGRDTAEFVWEALLVAGRVVGLTRAGVLAWEQLRGNACS